MPAVSEFTKAKIVTLHQRGMSYGQISTNLGLSKGTIHATHWDGDSASRFWKKAGVFRGTERGTPELSPKSVPVHEE
jgi:transposase